MRNIKIIAPSKDFPAPGKRHAPRGKLSSRRKTPCAPREAFATCETTTRSAGSFRNLRNGHALRGKLSQPAKRPRAPREAFATCEMATRSAGSFRNLRKSILARGPFFATCEKWGIMGQRLLLGLCLFLLTLIGTGCSTTKNLPEGEVLYEGIKRVTIAEQDPSDDGENTVSQQRVAR